MLYSLLFTVFFFSKKTFTDHVPGNQVKKKKVHAFNKWPANG